MCVTSLFLSRLFVGEASPLVSRFELQECEDDTVGVNAHVLESDTAKVEVEVARASYEDIFSTMTALTRGDTQEIPCEQEIEADLLSACLQYSSVVIEDVTAKELVQSLQVRVEWIEREGDGIILLTLNHLISFHLD